MIRRDICTSPPGLLQMAPDQLRAAAGGERPNWQIPDAAQSQTLLISIEKHQDALLT